MAEMLEDKQGLDTTTVGIYRTAAVMKGGRRFSFSALVVVGDRHGGVGLGYAKAPGVPAAIEKAQKSARKNMFKISLQEGTLPHSVLGKFGASSVKLIPAAPGTGVIAGGTVRAILELAGVRDCLTKAYGSTNQKNLSKAALEGLVQLRTKAGVSTVRGVELSKTHVDEVLEMGRRYVPAQTSTRVGARGPENLVGKKKRGGGGKGRGPGGRGRGGDRGSEGSVGGDMSAKEAKQSGGQEASS
jgi:small subunit ribosomal protein S5